MSRKIKETAWAVHNYGILVYQTISGTRREAIASALSMGIVQGDIRPTVANLKKHCPWYKVVKVSIDWEYLKEENT